MKPKLLLCFTLVLSGVLLVWNGTVLAQSSQGETAQVVSGNTQFSLDLYDKLRRDEGNIFFSPYSISTALAMTSAGARAKTLSQMNQTLHFDLAPDRLHPAFAALEADLNAVQQNGQVGLAEANSLWPQAGFKFLPDYLRLCRENYGTSIMPVDFRGHTEAARKKINNWVEERTSRKIVELLKPGIVDGATRLVLVNAIYFKGKWADPFETNLTEDSLFFVSPKKSLTAPLMHQMKDYAYAEFPDLQILELPYAGKDLSMVVLLPRARDGLGRLEARLTAQNLAQWTTGLESQTMSVFLPRFKMTSEFSLAKTLAAMGMTDAFDTDRADFSGMDGVHDLYISTVEHKAFVEVKEEGTEAAAATAVTMSFGGAVLSNPRTVSVFRADHPFLFLIRDNHTGSILFLGRVENPTQ